MSKDEKFKEFLENLDPDSRKLFEMIDLEAIEEDEVDALIDQFTMVDTRASHVATWFDMTLANLNLIDSEHSNVFNYQVFFVHIDGVLGEVTEYFQNQSDSVKKVGAIAGVSDEYSVLIDGILVLLSKMRALLSEPEVETINYLRNRFSHPLLDGYTIQITKKKIFDRRRGKKRPELRAIVKAELEKYDSKVTEIAKAYKQKVGQILIEINIEVKKWKSFDGRVLV